MLLLTTTVIIPQFLNLVNGGGYPCAFRKII